MESSASAGHSYSGAGNIGHAVLPSIPMAEPDTVVESIAAAKIAVHVVSPSRSPSAPGIELVTGASTVSMVMEMPANSTMQTSEVPEAMAAQDPPTDQTTYVTHNLMMKNDLAPGDVRRL
ncbi:hypothetical protein C2845_PM13G26260 [Panicum miliaceum]|uniref:Uncharacterized protein n=1 Tax=Panicum miliaceum TaxID=4540 RepID=A0A3L6RIX3_PANMI|nr:hypothetical protein C2845_PM13G26260 [Panicum miliaceum]